MIRIHQVHSLLHMNTMDTDITTVPTADLQEQIRLVLLDIDDLSSRPHRLSVEEIEFRHLTRWHALATEELSRRERELAEARYREELFRAQDWFTEAAQKSQEIVWARAAGSGPTDKDYTLVKLAKDFAENRIHAIPYIALYRQYAN